MKCCAEGASLLSRGAAAECSPGRKPGVGVVLDFKPRRGETVPGMFRPYGAVRPPDRKPTAYAVGYTLPPLRGSDRMRFARQFGQFCLSQEGNTLYTTVLDCTALLNGLQMIGQTISRYRLEERLGEGGMGVVYRARDLRLGRTVAFKTLRSELAADLSLRRRMATEAQAASALNHPVIATLFDFEADGDVAFLV